MENIENQNTITKYQKYKAAYRAASKRYYKKQRQQGNKGGNCSYKVKFLSAVKTRAKRNGVEFCLTQADIIFPENCPILNIPIDTKSFGRSDNSPSVDRIDNSKGYIPDNIRIISWRANRIKSDSTWQELEAIMNYVKTHMASN